LRQLGDVSREQRLVSTTARRLALCRPVLPQHAAREALGCTVLGDHMLDRGSATGGA
jgi:hypothetical protein